jgi:hypothetical protein
MVMWRPGVSIAAAAFAFALFGAGCGDDEADDHAHSGQEHDGGGHGLEPVPCPASTPEFKVGLEATGESANVTARIVEADYVPPRKGPNDWQVVFVDGEGMAVEDVAITKAEPYMPVHRHDGRYPPTVTELDDPGAFDVENINLHMGGPWEVRFTVESESAGDDYIVFNVCVED